MKFSLVLFVLAVLSTASAAAHELDVHAKSIDMSLPIYPESEKQAGRKGIATVLLRIDDKGNATLERAMASESYKFVDAATAAVKTWKFSPSRRDGKAAPDLLEFVLIFDPKDGVKILGPLYPR